MAGLIIGKLGFGKDDFFYGLELCLWKAGAKAYDVTPETASACDLLLVTLFWWRDVYLLEAFLRKAKIRKGGRTVIISGGMQSTMTPEIVARMVDYVFVGDADCSLAEIIAQVERGERPTSPHIYAHGDERVPEPCECAPSAFGMQKGGARDILRIEIARGCRFKCGFCALTGLKSYREVPFSEIEPILKSHEGASVSLFAPERSVHKDWPKFQAAIAEYNLKDHGQDVRLEGLHKIHSASATFGLEGISYKLRKVAGKPWKDKYVMERIENFVTSRQRIAYLSAYFIADLPGEDESDWAEVYELFTKIEAAEWSRRLTFKPILNPFSPKPFTPLAGSIVHPFRDYLGRWQNLLRKGGHGQWGFRLVETLVWGPFERIMDALATNGKADAYEVVRRLPPALLTGKPTMAENRKTAKELLKIARRYGLTNEVLRIEESEEIPAVRAPELLNVLAA